MAAARPREVVLENADALVRAIAEKIWALPQSVSGRPVTIALAGGSTPKRLYEVLAQPPQPVDWTRFEFFFGDERSVPPEHPDSNFGMANAALLAKVGAKAHRMVAEKGEAEAYARLLDERIPAKRGSLPVFDLVLLGVGNDGHTASLFPGTTALDETAKTVAMNDVPQLETRRMTLTYPTLNAAARVWFLITGEGKREIVVRCRKGLADANAKRTYPMLGVRPEYGELVWWLDKAACGTVS